jgi:2-polyprenyl-3-methyl-5-hydroxy-6-metoxy-1,4-benzoquinol methylase
MVPERFTGERPGRGVEFAYDEARALAAYRYALTLARDRSLLDAGCGEGFGTVTLTTVARAVVGMDYSADAVAVCRRTWERPNLRFVQHDLTDLEAYPERFDLIVSFQVLEHLVDPRPFLTGLRAHLASGGRLLLTTPNRLTSFSENPYHVREYSAAELRELLAGVFGRVTILGMHGNAKVTAFDRARAQAVRRILRLDPLGIRRLLPARLVTFAFARLAVAVRRRVRRTGETERIVPEDFYVGEQDLDAAVDLIALCET